MDFQALLSEHKELVGVVVAGVFGIVAALIKSKMKFSAPLIWFFVSLFCLAAGAALLFLEQAQFHFDPHAGVGLQNRNSLLALAGCLLLAAGGIWGIINFLRLFLDRPLTLPDAPPGKKR